MKKNERLQNGQSVTVKLASVIGSFPVNIREDISTRANSTGSMMRMAGSVTRCGSGGWTMIR